MNPVLVIGGYGTFGSLVCRELVRHGTSLTVAGRDEMRARAFAADLGGSCDALPLDLTLARSRPDLLQGRRVVVNCAGPFRRFDTSLLDACRAAGCHCADIADDREYVRLVREQNERLVGAGVAAVFGCSSLPAISGALALRLRAQRAEAPSSASVTLLIGNDNPKGEAAVTSFIEGLGRPIRAAQGVLTGGRGREMVTLPEPFGRRVVLNFDSPEYDLFPALLGASQVSVKIGFELRIATELAGLLARSGRGFGPRTARLLAQFGNWTRGTGCSGGVVMSELLYADGTRARLAIVTESEGQRLAALPCALVARSLSESTSARFGAQTAYELLGPENLLQGLLRAIPQARIVP
jgi:NAD(P)-dependent dehydrogenase (short-subunit alcohol dehydrogenase family)